MASPTVREWRLSSMPPDRLRRVVTTLVGDEPDALSTELAFRLLANQRRRHVVETLLEASEPLTLTELVEAVVEAEASTTDAESSLRDSVYASLHQTHLPWLVAEDIVEYDTADDRIVLTDRGTRLRQYLETPQPQPVANRWPLVYLGAAIGFGAVILLWWRRLDALTSIWIAAVGAGMFLALSLLHLIVTRQ